MHGDPADALRDALEHSTAGIALFDADERLRRANARFTDFFGASADGATTWESMMRRCHRERRGLRIAADDIDAWLARVRLTHRRAPVRSFESDLADGRWLWVEETLHDDGWLLVVCIDISPLKAHEATLRKAHDAAVLASLTDPLTELYNRRFIFRRLDDLLASCRQLRVPLCAAVIDIDHFKRINDARGHGAGDAVLRRFAAQLKAQVRPLDAIGRIGGEEFLFLMPNATLAGARAVLERLRESGREAAPGESACTFSAGVTSASDDDDADTLVRRADVALYLAKQQGRDRHVALEADGSLPSGDEPAPR